MRAGPGRAALARRRRWPPELSPQPLLLPALLLRPASSSTGLLLLRLRPGLRRRPGALSPGSQGMSPPPGASRTKAGGTGGRTMGCAVEAGAALALCVEPGELRAGMSAGRGRARGKVQPPGAAARPGAPRSPWDRQPPGTALHHLLRGMCAPLTPARCHLHPAASH
ncbi:cortactin-binding protein 2 isoform X1 [Ursus arctos]|uniref:cortactin-binding protein 2 isoform X1 n=1 Tax=Ursus arctos TaxID=9644 RepID=UPI0025499B4D|nr:cortactin-binding protein 2 isoform X1 [Ursus arctos]